MNYSRAQLYAAGEPLGDCATRTKPGGRVYGGGGGGGSSSSASTSTTNNTDARVVGGDGSTNLSMVGNTLGAGSAISVTSTDHGAIAGAVDLARTSLTTAKDVTQTAMGTTKQVFDGALESVEDAYSTARAGDQKIVSIAGMAVIGIAAITLLSKRG